MIQNVKDAVASAVTSLQFAASAVLAENSAVLASNDLPAIIRHFDWLREINEQIKIARKSLEIVEDRLSHSEIPDAFKAVGVKTMTVDGVGRVSIGRRWACSMVDKDRGMAWLRENGDGGLIIETVNSSTLAAHAKDLLENHGKELPQELFHTHINAYTSITKA